MVASECAFFVYGVAALFVARICEGLPLDITGYGQAVVAQRDDGVEGIDTLFTSLTT